MRLNFTQSVITIAVIALTTMLTRYLPFLIFPEKREIPKFIEYLGKVLPPAMMGLLVVFCFKDLKITASPFGIPELISVAVVALLQVFKKNVLLSIGVGTALYMVLVQFVFK